MLADANRIDITGTLDAQRASVQQFVDAMTQTHSTDVVQLWRYESAQAATRFLDRLA